jgi:hypothetical protein
MKSDTNMPTCQRTTWARLANGRGTRSKRLVSCVLANLINKGIVLLKKVRGLKSSLLNVYPSKQNQRVQK